MSQPSAADLWGLGDYPRIAERLLPAAEALVAAAGVTAGQRVLDVAAGTGNVAFLCAQAGATVTATDIAPRMVELGAERTRDLDVAWSVADAQDLPFADASFDCALSVFGAMFGPDQPRTATELLRVVRPGGLVAMTAWVPEGPQADAMARIASITQGPTMMNDWGRAAIARGHFEQAGAAAVTVEERLIPWTFASLEAWMDLMEHGPGPMVAMREAMGERWPPVRRELLDLMRAATGGGDGPVDIRNAYLLITARP